MNDKFYKLVMVGDSSVGKTSLIARAIHDKFDHEHMSTIGAAFSKYISTYEDGICEIQLWDTAGQERYNSLLPMYFRGMDLALVVFDYNDMRTFKRITDHWIPQILKHTDKENYLIFIVGNKVDMVSDVQLGLQEKVVLQKLDNLDIEYVYKQASAKTGLNVSELFKEMADKLYHTRTSVVSNRQEITQLEDNVKPVSRCCY